MQSQAVTEHADANDEMVSRSLRVLVVDDLEAHRRLATTVFEALGCRVSTAHDGFAAVALAGGVDFDLIVMDRNMPNCDGDRATRIIRASRNVPDVRIVSHSSCPPTGSAANLYDGVIPKPARLADFVEYVLRNVQAIPMRAHA
jgi:CheY-like chemotaxis protein